MFRAIVFDLGKVIIPFDVRRAIDALVPHCAYSAREIPALMQETSLANDLETGRIEPEAFFQAVKEKLHVTVGYDEFCRIWNSIFAPETLIPESLLEGLARRYRLLLLSNTNAIHFDAVEKGYPLLRHFHHFVLSYRVGAMKPDAAIYREAVRLAGCEPRECLFIDDIQENVDGAAREGLAAIRFESLQQLEQDLTRLGVLGNGPVTMKDCDDC
jgi:putative hydrolase of the HAD superfamily